MGFWSPRKYLPNAQYHEDNDEVKAMIKARWPKQLQDKKRLMLNLLQ